MSASSAPLSPAPSSAPRSSDLKALVADSEGDLEWRVSEISARWLLAGRNIAEEYPGMTQSDVIAWKIRVAGLAFYAALQVFGCTVGLLFSVISGSSMTNVFICTGQMLAVGLVLVSMHTTNRSMKVSVPRTADVSALMLVVICLFGITCLWPFNSVFTFRGWHWSSGITVWQWASAMGPILVVKSSAIRTGCVVFLITVVLDSLLIASCRLWVGEGPADLEDTDTFAYAMLSVFTTYAMVPPVVALFFRRACQEYRWKLYAVRSHQERLDAFRASSRFLIFTLIPPVRATQLTHSSPALWHRGSQDTWEDCSLVQMDVSGFTAMSSRIESEELVGLINALFTSTEYAAECIGNIWVVELIGDCCKFMVGGPSPCPDHAYRAAVLAYSIVEVFKHVALRLGVALTVRVGIHTGTVVGAVVGSSMPRYLLHGPACEVVGRLETSAPAGGVLASEATAAALGDAWPHEEAQDVALADGTLITGRLSDALIVEERMAAARLAYPALGDLLSDFEHGVFDHMTGTRRPSCCGVNLYEDSSRAGRSGTSMGFLEDSSLAGGPTMFSRMESSEDGVSPTRATDRLVRRIRIFSASTATLPIRAGASVLNVAKGRQAAGLTSVAFGGSFGRTASYGRASLAFALAPNHKIPFDRPLRSVSVSAASACSKAADHVSRRSESNDVASTRSTVEAEKGASRGGSAGTAGSRPSLTGLRSQAVLEREEGGRGEGGEGDTKRENEGHSQLAVEHKSAVPALPTIRLKSAARRGTQDRISGLRSLPDGRPPTRLLAPVEEAAGRVAPRERSDVERTCSATSLQDWQTDLIGAEEEAVPAGATLDPEQEARADVGWENQHGATPIEFQRSIVLLFITVLTAVTGVHTVLVVVLHFTDQIDFYVWESSAAQQLVVVLPALQLLLLLTAILVNKYSKLDWGSGTPQLVATILVFVSPFALEGSVSGRSCNPMAILWGGAAVLIPCSTTPINSSRWWAWMAGYWVVCFALLGWQEYKIPGGVEPLTRDVAWWREMLIALHFWATGALMLATLGLASNKVALEQDKARALFHKTKSEAFLEGKLLNALLPAVVIERFLRGDTLIADRIQDGTVMFIYINGYRETLLEHGTAATIQWINRVFEALDVCISRTSSIIKVETFNDFLLVYSKQPDTHVEECISLAIDMLDSIRLVLRPDGASTTVKLGASSGDFTAGIIGSSAPRYSIFGDTVNTASRMAAHSRPCTFSSFFMHLSDTAKDKVGAALEGWLMANLTLSIVENGQGMEIKGKGWMQTFCLCRLESWTDGIQESPSQRGRM